MSTLLMTGRSMTGRHGPQIFALVREVFAAALREIEARRGIRALMAADDATLADLGVSRGAIETAVRGGRRSV